uniref:G-protein coupled receptors family 2 profile 2 domain-containing protein n=1 Tax=Neogobius melanostomus TaxID=47308 RepID=A0A8C6U366_9GOBI
MYVCSACLQNILKVVDELSAEKAASSWQVLNMNKNSNASSQLLNALEILSKDLQGEFSITTPRVMLNRTTFNNSFSADLNSGITVEILDTQFSNVFITTIAFSSLNNILPPRNATFNISSLTSNSTDNSTDVFNNVINAGVVLINVNQEINNVMLAYEKRNRSLSLAPQCVFWNFDLLDGLGAWDSEDVHLFRTLRTHKFPNIYRKLWILSLTLHCFDATHENYEVPVGPCSAATFFMHFFYLALFFWMLVSGMLLFYRTAMVFSHMSKSSMLAIGFCVGYGAPLIIAIVTVATTASINGYIRKYEACWLNWDETMALLALMLRSGGIGEASDEKHTLKMIVRCVLILTPLFGLTWSLGVGTFVAPTNKGIHIAFAFLNSLQGLFILIFGTFFDSKVSLLQTSIGFLSNLIQ